MRDEDLSSFGFQGFHGLPSSIFRLYKIMCLLLVRPLYSFAHIVLVIFFVPTFKHVILGFPCLNHRPLPTSYTALISRRIRPPQSHSPLSVCVSSRCCHFAFLTLIALIFLDADLRVFLPQHRIVVSDCQVSSIFVSIDFYFPGLVTFSSSEFCNILPIPSLNQGQRLAVNRYKFQQ